MARSVGKFTVGQSRDIPFTPPGAGPNSCDPEHPLALHRLGEESAFSGYKTVMADILRSVEDEPAEAAHMLWRPSSDTSVARLRAHRQRRSLFRLGA
jgi:hypothetical protein